MGCAAMAIAVIASRPLSGPGGRVLDVATSATPPATVIVDQALKTDQGISLTWLESQPGNNPIAYYVIERRTGSAAFAEVAKTEAGARNYLDVAGTVGDDYQITAQDDQTPPLLSKPSAIITAQDLSPKVLTSDQTPSPTASAEASAPDATPQAEPVSSPAAAPAGSSDAFGDRLQTQSNQAANHFDTFILGRQPDLAGPDLITLGNSNRSLLSALAGLTPERRQAAADSCAAQSLFLESDLHILPEALQMDGLLALASCQAIENPAP